MMHSPRHDAHTSTSAHDRDSDDGRNGNHAASGNDHHDGTDNLVRMANRIGDFFAHQPGAEANVDGIANHIEKFWEPRMRRQILDFLASNPAGVTAAGTILHDIVRLALQRHRARLDPGPAPMPPDARTPHQGVS